MPFMPRCFNALWMSITFKANSCLRLLKSSTAVLGVLDLVILFTRLRWFPVRMGDPIIGSVPCTAFEIYQWQMMPDTIVYTRIAKVPITKKIWVLFHPIVELSSSNKARTSEMALM